MGILKTTQHFGLFCNFNLLLNYVFLLIFFFFWGGGFLNWNSSFFTVARSAAFGDFLVVEPRLKWSKLDKNKKKVKSNLNLMRI